ncbi:MAG: outer membrane beta-barrel protein [Rhodoferax sp.]|uniref:OmpW/AlkL family protein n=1 Tax=Rhodoferax sp. TaxID=50421 RepID=UPI0026344F9B|nr:OmpW family outer membrane protein [Rhodoferax sp.]MDD2879951.1 outer membrane beta-barrel protein [Rhodoferax sp.]
MNIINNKWVVVASLLGLCGFASAQSAGTWMVRAGATNITPSNPSGNLSAPAFYVVPRNGIGSQTNTGSDTQLGGGFTYMYTDHLSVDVPLALPFKHKLYGAGAIEGVGQIGEVQALPMTVFLQYRFLEANAKFRPYVGLGATYAYLFNEEGSGTLTALSNPGGTPTKISADSKLALTAQIGATLALNDKWFVDVFYSKTKLTTKITLSTGQTVDAALDPATYGVAVGYKF